MPQVSKYRSPHFHVTLIEDESPYYDYTDYLPIDPIRQFSCMVAMIDGKNFKGVSSEVAQHFLKSHNEGVDAYYITGGTYMAEGVYRCYKPCYISPSMN